MKRKVGIYKNGALEIVEIDSTPEEEAVVVAARAEAEAEDANREPTADERIKQLEEQNAMLLECLLEMSEIVYA